MCCSRSIGEFLRQKPLRKLWIQSKKPPSEGPLWGGATGSIANKDGAIGGAIMGGVVASQAYPGEPLPIIAGVLVGGATGYGVGTQINRT